MKMTSLSREFNEYSLADSVICEHGLTDRHDIGY